MGETNIEQELFESPLAALYKRRSYLQSAVIDRRYSLFLARIAPHQFALRDYMAFDRGIELASFGAER